MTTPHHYADILRAIADEKQVQILEGDGVWRDRSAWDVLYCMTSPHGHIPRDKIRIKPEPVKARYRVAEMITSDGCHIAVAAGDDVYAEYVQSRPHFRRWLTDWVEYEVSE